MSKQLLDIDETINVGADDTNVKYAKLIPDREEWQITTIDTKNVDTNITLNDVLIDGQSLSINTFPVDLKDIFGGRVPAYEKIEIDVSETSSSAGTFDLVIQGLKKNT